MNQKLPFFVRPSWHQANQRPSSAAEALGGPAGSLEAVPVDAKEGKVLVLKADVACSVGPSLEAAPKSPPTLSEAGAGSATVTMLSLSPMAFL
mmetsp:Transcript_12056/g.34111  ORF Transcript_12056/g.34111 Transcript_12056/m.34111 type:complete len:93 (-) Transcript_12056:204-482(-)